MTSLIIPLNIIAMNSPLTDTAVVNGATIELDVDPSDSSSRKKRTTERSTLEHAHLVSKQLSCTKLFDINDSKNMASMRGMVDVFLQPVLNEEQVSNSAYMLNFALYPPAKAATKFNSENNSMSGCKTNTISERYINEVLHGSPYVDNAYTVWVDLVYLEFPVMRSTQTV